MNKLFFGIGAVILLYGCFFYNKMSNKKFNQNIDLEENKSINLKENIDEENVEISKELEDIVDNLVTNVVALSQKKDKKEKKVSFDDNWIEIDVIDKDHNEDIL